MRIIRARAMGFCFGVRDALETARSVAHPERVAVYGELVHNERVQAELAERGFAAMSERDRQRLPERPEVLITAHGVSERERDRLVAAGKTLIDTTCPLVTYVHRVARALEQEGRLLVVVGKRDHVEVRGIVGDLSHFVVVAGPGEVEAYTDRRIGVIAQTTTPPRQAEAVVEAVRERNPAADVKYVMTSCQPTRDRQLAVLAMLPWIEALIVVGGKNSNNTRQLVDLAREQHVPAYHVQGPDDVEAAWLTGLTVVGLTAGTSTPDDVIEAVHARLVELAHVHPWRRAASF
ncbi:4-hydroxy-3-methylbut-2-enyl diphosphate reductase [bacterium]|nr:4-hydroxy-3-methylbut-2-enyl diphosphate reductase [bacterium]